MNIVEMNESSKKRKGKKQMEQSMMPPGLMMRAAEKETTEMPIGMAYVPIQAWREIYENDKGFIKGTVFAELDKPFGGCKR